MEQGDKTVLTGTRIAKAKKRKWFLNEYFGRITQRVVTGWDEIHHRTTGAYYFDTWEEAHAHLTAKTAKRLKQAKAELPAAHRAVERVARLKPPVERDKETK